MDNPDTIWCVCTENYDTGEECDFTIEDPKYLEKLCSYLADATEIIGHNLIGFDIPILNRFIDVPISLSTVYDTLVVSRISNPVRIGGHSLASWARYFGLVKVEHDEWDRFSPEMLSRCRTDVSITRRVYQQLLKESRKFSKLSIRLECSVAAILEDARHFGFAFDVNKANRLYQECYSKAAELESRIRETFPCLIKPVKSVTPRRKKDGSWAISSLGPYRNRSSDVGGPFTSIKYQEFDLNSPKQIVERLNRIGWKPIEKTPGGQPKVSEANLATIPEGAPEEARSLREYMILTNRHRMLANWLTNLGADDRIHGKIFHIGAITHRCGHRDPNTANIPGIKDKMGRPNPYGRECRELWTVGDTTSRRLLGVDAKGIQARVLASLMDDPEFTKTILEGDIHTWNIGKTEVGTRESNKRFFYAWLLGAQGGKVAEIFGLPGKKEGYKVIDRYLVNIPALSKVKKLMKVYAKRGLYPASDGRFIPIKSEHYALSCALQGEESIIMKLAMVLAYKEIKRYKLDCHLVGFVHDELLYDCALTDVEKCATIVVEAIERAGRMLKMKCPMTGNAKIGFNWAEVH